MAKLNETRLIEAVNRHRDRAHIAEQRWKERYYDWELMYFMRYKKEDLQTKGSDSQQRSYRSNQYIGYAHAQIETATAKALSALFVKNPPFDVDPAGGSNFEDANLVKALHAWSFKKDRMLRTTRQALRFMFIYGTVFFKHLWNEEWILRGERIATEAGVDENGRTVWEYRTIRQPELMYEGPSTYIVDPYYVHVEPFAESLDSAEWIQEEFIRSGVHIKRLMKQGIYRNVSLKGVDTHSINTSKIDYRNRRKDVIGSIEQQQTDSDLDPLSLGMYDLIEEWHDDRRITIIGRPGGKQKVLIDEPNPYHHGKKPYTQWSYLDIANEVWALPMSRQIEGVQSEINMIRRMRSDALLTNLRRMWRISPDARHKIKKNDLVFRPDGIIVAEKGELEPLPVTDLDIFSYKEETILREDGDLLTGITDVVRGSAAPSTTATVGTLNAQFATDRLSMTLDSVADGFDEMLTMRHQLYRQFATRDQMVQIAGPEGVQSVNVPISRIRGNYMFKFTAGRGLAQREVQRTQLLNILTIAAQNPLVGSRVDFEKLIHDTFATFDALPDPSRYILQQPHQSIPQEQEIMVMMTGVPMPVNQIDNHTEHLQILSEFIQGEEFASAHPSIKEIIENHGKEHIPFAKNQLAAQEAQGTLGPSGSPDRASVPGNAVTEGDVIKNVNSQNAPSVRTT